MSDDASLRRMVYLSIKDVAEEDADCPSRLGWVAAHGGAAQNQQQHKQQTTNNRTTNKQQPNRRYPLRRRQPQQYGRMIGSAESSEHSKAMNAAPLL
jgi:hypothetical protein